MDILDTRQTFDDAILLREKILRTKVDVKVPIVLVGHKCDSEHLRQVPKNEGEQLARDWGEHSKFYEANAKAVINHEIGIFAIDVVIY